MADLVSPYAQVTVQQSRTVRVVDGVGRRSGFKASGACSWTNAPIMFFQDRLPVLRVNKMTTGMDTMMINKAGGAAS